MTLTVIVTMTVILIVTVTVVVTMTMTIHFINFAKQFLKYMESQTTKS